MTMNESTCLFLSLKVQSFAVFSSVLYTNSVAVMYYIRLRTSPAVHRVTCQVVVPTHTSCHMASPRAMLMPLVQDFLLLKGFHWPFASTSDKKRSKSAKPKKKKK